MSSKLILRKYRSSEKLELTFENVEDLSVQELRENASSKLGISLDELKLVYGGRVLKVGKSVAEYKVASGCTIYGMAVKSRKSIKDQPLKRKKGGLMNNRRVLTLIGRVLGNPALLQEMAQGMELAPGSAAMLQLLGNQQILASLSDPDNIQEYIHDNPDVSAMMEHMIRQFLGSSVEGSLEEQDEEQLVDLLESQLEEEMAEMEEEEGEAQRAQAQEQMFEHSQALHAHSQQQRQQSHTPTSSTAAPSSQQESSYDPLASLQHGTVSSVPRQPITQDQLASALASAMSSSSSLNASPLASLNQPQLHRSISDQSSAVPPPPYSAVLQPGAVGGAVGGAGSAGPISAATLRQVLANVVGAGDAGSQVAEASGGSSISEERARYRAQLEQLRLMGIEDETACLHALAATGGDLQAALEILYSQ